MGTCTQSNLYPIWKCSYFYLSPQDNVSVDPPLDIEATADGELLPHVPVSKRFTKINVLYAMMISDGESEVGAVMLTSKTLTDDSGHDQSQCMPMRVQMMPHESQSQTDFLST